MKIKELIKNKDYDYISWRITLPKSIGGGDTFLGACKSKDGKLISLDGDSYSEDTKVLSHYEWSSGRVKNGLTVVVKGSLWRGKNK